ncbi:MAG TPA: hypothetical protein VIW25_15025, partial [Nitrososphaeraceae archaeon]
CQIMSAHLSDLIYHTLGQTVSIAQITVSSLTGIITTAGSSNSSTLVPIASLGLPLTSSAAGFAIGFMKGRMEKNKE